MSQCYCCQTENPIGGLNQTQKSSAEPPFREPVLICDICYHTFIGNRYLAGGVTETELLVMAQIGNIIRKDIAGAKLP